MRRFALALLAFLWFIAAVCAQTVITQAMVSAGGPAGYYITAPGEYIIGTPINHPFSYGYAIQSSVVWDKSPIVIRNPYGYPIWCSAGGSGTQAVGVGIYGTSLHWHGRGPESFRVNIAARCPPGNLNVGGAHQLLDVTVRSGYYAGLVLEGHDTLLSNVRVLTVGGGTGGASRPIGIQLVGDRPRFDDVSIHDVNRGPADTETMHLHLDRSTGARGELKLYQRERQSRSYGVWFNGSWDAHLALTVDNVDTAVAAELWSGRLTGRTINVSCTSTLPTTGSSTPTVDLN